MYAFTPGNDETLLWLGSRSRSPPAPPPRSFRGATSGRRSASNAPPHACREGTRGPHAAPVPAAYSLHGTTSGCRIVSNAPPHACHEGTRGPLSPPAWSLYSLHGAMHPTCVPAMKPRMAHVDPWSLTQQSQGSDVWPQEHEQCTSACLS